MFLRTFFLAILFAAPIYAEPPVLSLPIDCTLGETCFVQQYMDVDPSNGVRDFGGGRATYNGHGGTDIRLKSGMMMEQGVHVLASAAGRVTGFRNNMVDRAAHTDADRAALMGKDCGNGVEIDHGDGWKTKYCHMKQDSIRVRKNQRVAVGDVLGQVGLSGRTQVAHLHITVTKDGVKIDPFAPDNNLWTDDLKGVLAYQPTQIINIGFANQAIDMDDIEAGTFATYHPTRRASALVGFVRVINMVKGDQIRIKLVGPEGGIVSKTYDPVPRQKAQKMNFAGKKAPRGGWSAGEYIVVGEVLRGGVVLVTETLKETTP